MTEKTEFAALKALAAKGDGLLTRVGTVWTYPGCPIDPSGTNLRLPLEYASDADVQAALSGGALAAVTQTPGNQVLSVRFLDGGATPAILSTAQAGSAEAGTELPLGSRPTHDAGLKAISPEEAAQAAAHNIDALRAQANAPEGASKASPQGFNKEPADAGARKGR